MLRNVIVSGVLLVGTLQGAWAEDSGWPRQFETDGASVVVYQPQIDSWDNQALLKFRMATSVQRAADKEPTFGVIRIAAKTKVNQEQRTVLLTEPESSAHFPDTDPAEAEALVGIVRAALPERHTLEVDLDRVLACLSISDVQARPVDVNLKPPPIFYSSEPAILIVFMGQPRFRPVADTNLLFATNTNWPVFLESGSAKYYLLSGDTWLTAEDPRAGQWVPAQQLPDGFAKLPDDDNWSDVRAHIPGKPAAQPLRVFVSDQPAELIVTDGEPELTPIPGANLLFVANTDSDLFMNISDGSYYLLVAGRWFQAPKLAGPWTAATKTLPDNFAAIPEDHERAAVLASVPGTPEAEEAVIQASIPQRATVQRAELSLEVTYDGAPKFKVIDGSDGVSYALNTTYTVLAVKDQFYCCENGVWFVSPKPDGPWVVCADVPEEIYSIPSNSPLHNVTYVYVYDSDPQTVTVGYTSGYNGAYVANGLLMFGAGMALGYAIGDDDDDWYPWHVSACYYSYGCAARYSYYHGGYVRAAHYYGPYGGTGFAARYNPVTGTYARGAYAYGPYGSAGVARAYNPVTGAHARGGYRSGPLGTAAGGSVYNPRTGRGAATRQADTPYGSWGRSVVSDGDDWARFGHRSGPAGTTAGGKTSGGSAGIVHKGDDGWTYRVKGPGGDVYAGRDGEVYRRGESNDWQRHSNRARQWSSTGVTGYDREQVRTRPEHWDGTAPRRSAATPNSAGRERPGTADTPAERAAGGRSDPGRQRDVPQADRAPRDLNRDSWSRDRGNNLSSRDRSGGRRGGGGGGGRRR